MSSKTRIPAVLLLSVVGAFLAAASAALQAQGQSPKVLGFKKQFAIEIRNTESFALENHAIVLSVGEIRAAVPDFNSYNYAIFEETGAATTLVVSQADDLDKDRYHDEIVLVRTLPASSRTRLTCYYAPKGSFQLMTPAKAFARLFGPAGGPAAAGWESNLCAFRFAGGRIEPFGKLTQGLVLKNPGAADAKPQEWGMKTLDAGPSAGLGGLSLWDGATRIPLLVPEGGPQIRVRPVVAAAGPLRSMVKAEYSGIVTPQGEYGLTLSASAFADNPAARLDVRITTKAQGQMIFGPGINKLASAVALVDGAGGVVSVWGRGSGAADEIGLAVFFEPSDFAGTEETGTDRWVKLTGRLVGGHGGPGLSGVDKTYWILSGWIRGLGAPAYPAARNWPAKARDTARQVRGRVEVSYKAF